MIQDKLASLLPDCCRIGYAAIEEYSENDQRKIFSHFSETRTVIVLANHIMDSLEWTWFKFPNARTGSTHPADLHSLSIANLLSAAIDKEGGKGYIVPYPGPCDLMFKLIALPTKMGILGDNFLYLMEDWGPWNHLRVILTDLDIEHVKPKLVEPCFHCGKCMEVCPSNAIKHNDFDGLACQKGMKEQSQEKCDGSFCFECELCLRACPVGVQPKEITVKFK